MEIEGSLLHLQKPAMCPYPELHQSSPCLLSHFLKILILSSRLCLSLPRGLFSFPQFSQPKLCMHLYWPPYLLRAPSISFSSIWSLNLITQTIFGEQYRPLSSSLCSFLHSPVTSYLLGPNILLSTLCSNTLSLCSSLSVSDQDSHPNKTTGKIIVLFILIFIFWIANWKKKILHWMIASITWLQYTLNFFMNRILIH